MKENIDISEFDKFFRQQLESATSAPPAGVWEGISSGISATATTATSSAIIVKSAIWVKIGIGVIATAAIATVVYIASDNAGNGKQRLPASTAPVKEAQHPELPADISPEVISEKPTYQAIRNLPIAEKSVSKPVLSYKSETESEKTDNQKENELPEFKLNQFEQSNLSKDYTIEFSPVKEEVKEKYEPVTEGQPEAPVRKVDSTVIVIPNAVTPNGDGSNDTYLIDIKGEEHVRIIIYDINENIVFETTNKYMGWNCNKPGGEEYSEGTYIVKVIYKFPGLSEQTKTKQLKLIR